MHKGITISSWRLPIIMLLVCMGTNTYSQSKVVPDSIFPIIAQHGINDTIICTAVIYQGDTIEAKILAGVYLWGKSKYSARKRAEWTRLRNAVYVTYPYARRAGWVFSDIENHIQHNPDKAAVSKYINSRERELKKNLQCR